MTNAFFIEMGSKSDYEVICTLLLQHKLPIEDIKEERPQFFIIKKNESLAGVIGLEVYGEFGLLRSMATDSAYRNKGIASSLVAELFNYGKKQGLKEIYLLTETAEGYFTKKGFVKINRDEVPVAIKQSAEFSHLCPSTAVAMKKEIQ